MGTVIVNMTIIEGCEPNVRVAIEAVISAFATASRRASVWSLVRELVEPPFSECVRNYGGLSYPACFRGKGLADCMKHDWKEFERLSNLYIQLLSNKNFQATLESVFYLGLFCKSQVPKRSVGKNALRGEAPQTVRRVFDGLHFPFCELCWRSCQAVDENDMRKRRSMRFCNEHAPKKSEVRNKSNDLIQNTQYRSAWNYREKFHEKLKEIYLELPRQREKWIALVGDIDPQSIRRYAYEFVHARVVDNRLKVLELKNEGYKNIEIAKLLGISRQAVYKFLDKNQFPKTVTGRTANGTIVDLRNTLPVERFPVLEQSISIKLLSMLIKV